MKTIIVEGNRDCTILNALFPQIVEREISIQIGQGFSNVLAISRTYLDYRYDVLAILDAGSHLHGDYTKETVERFLSNNPYGRGLNIVWMDPFIEKVVDRAIPGFWHRNISKNHTLRAIIEENRNSLLQLDEFRRIREFIDK